MASAHRLLWQTVLLMRLFIRFHSVLASASFAPHLVQDAIFSKCTWKYKCNFWLASLLIFRLFQLRIFFWPIFPLHCILHCWLAANIVFVERYRSLPCRTRFIYWWILSWLFPVWMFAAFEKMFMFVPGLVPVFLRPEWSRRVLLSACSPQQGEALTSSSQAGEQGHGDHHTIVFSQIWFTPEINRLICMDCLGRNLSRLLTS